MATTTTHNPTFWKEGVVYQIYPSSFKDSTGNGWGDLNGITSKLPYLKSLGVDIVWLSPIYKSPMCDMGYDIQDYRQINPDMGTLEDWERMVARAHELGLKLVMDLVVNHTSDQHEWFQESKNGGKNGPKRDWYYWKPKNEVTGKEPNNWGAMFGGSAWEWHEPSQEYFLHVYDVTQPDLNWTNPEVRNAVWDIMEFWLSKGCDGFRMDVINGVSKGPEWGDVPVHDERTPYQFGFSHRFNGPKLQDYLNEMHEKVLCRYPNAFTVGEMPGIKTPQEAIKNVQHGKPLQMIFNFEHMFVDIKPGKKVFESNPDWKLTDLKGVLGTWMTHMQEHDGWDSLYIENHDQPRVTQRWGSGAPEHRVKASKMLAIFHATGRGTLFIYQGQEMGATNPKSWTYEELRDLEEINWYNFHKDLRPEGADMSDVLASIQTHGRDNARTVIAWDDTPNGGFTTGTPWIKVNEDYKEYNIKAQEGKEGSVLEFWRSLLKIRKAHPALVYGYLKLLDEPNEQIYAYTRTDEKGEYLIVCNFSGEEVKWKSPVKAGELLIGSHDGKVEEGIDELTLKPYEGRLYLKKAWIY